MIWLILACGSEPHWSEDPVKSRKMVIQRDEKIEKLTERNARQSTMITELQAQLESKWYETEQAQEYYKAKLAREKVAKIEAAERSWCSMNSELIDIVSYGVDSHHLEGNSCGFDAKCRRCEIVLKERFTTPPNDTLKITFKRGCSSRDWEPSDTYCPYGQSKGYWMAAHRRDGTVAYYETIGIGMKHEY